MRIKSKNVEPRDRIPRNFPANGELKEGGDMASFEKVDGGWRAHIARAGVRKSKTFSSKTAATLWAAQQESEIASGGHSKWPNMTFADAMRKYELEVSSKKRGKDFEAKRFAALARDFPDLAQKVISQITAADLANWRDNRLEQVSASTVVREAALFRNVFIVAAREWSWLGEPTPWAKVKSPRHDPPRTRQTQPTELKMILRRLGFVTETPPSRSSEEVAWAYLISNRTGMRAGEILSLSTETVDLTSRVIKLVEHKTVEREGQRFVPITRQSRRLLSVLDQSARSSGRKNYFSINSQVLDTLFRKARDQLLISNLRFHDARAAALTRLARKVDVMTLARISGHRDLNQLLKSYYRESASEIAARL
jgi:integrase